MKRVLPLIAALAALPIVGTGCGGGGNNNSGGTSSKTLSASAANNAKGTVTWCIGKDTSGAFSKVVKLHNQQNPNVQAKLLELPESADQQRTQQVQRLRAKSSECDVLGMDVIWTAEYAAQGWLYNLTPVVNDRRGVFIPSTLETAKYQGKYWALPFNTNAGFIYYRTDQTSSAPKTWQQLYSQARTTKGFVYQGAQYEGLTVNFLEMLYAAGGQVLNSDGKSAAIDSPQTRSVLQLMRNGITDGAVPKAVTTYQEEDARRAFEAGNATFMRNWPYAYALGQQSAIKNKFAVNPLPQWSGGTAASVLGGYNSGISVYSKQPGAALEFANFLSSPQAQRVMMTQASLPATLTQTYSDPAVRKDTPFAAELLTAVQQGRARPVSPVYPQITQAIYTNVHNVLTGTDSVNGAAQKMQSQIDQALKTF